EMIDDTFLNSAMTFSEFTQGPLIISPNLISEDIISPKNGTLYSNSSMNEIYFEIKTTAPKE
ncbi:MAG TPA: hypothetical protein DCS66_06270, partial [Flavobacteriaceae bacterium]|nr:hypothetical protein [Flavobacteriaceae bacterium]